MRKAIRRHQGVIRVIDSSLRVTLPFLIFPHSILAPALNDDWMKALLTMGNGKRHNDGGTLSIIMTENIRRHSEQQRRICYCDEGNGKKIKAISCKLSATS